MSERLVVDMDTSSNTAELVELSELTRPAHNGAGKTGSEIPGWIKQAAGEQQDAMDAALLAGLLLEPKFTRIENRLAQCGMRLDSFVCKVSVFRKLA